jgi:serine phosphatase RsbU (regulator of sigma subunit)
MHTLQFSATYAPPQGNIVGGDWFDILRLPDDRTFIAIGDAVGHGVAATATMCDIRPALCMAAMDLCSTPARILQHASEAMLRSNPDALASAFAGTIDERSGRLCYASAGHPPAVLAGPLGARLLHATGSMLGYALSGLENGEVYLERGALLVLYTDGLTEFDRNVIEGERLLLNSAIAEAHNPSPNPASSIIARTLGDAKPCDDVAVLTVRVGGALTGEVHMRSLPTRRAAALQW